MKLVSDLLRIRQWVKNLLLFIPAFFAGTLYDFSQLKSLLVGAVAFSVVASGVYVINDIKDRRLDQIHPKKKFRPIASKKITLLSATLLSMAMLTVGLALSASIHFNYFLLLTTYLLINLFYSFGLKNVPIIDLLIVAFGFLIRIYAGGIISNVPVSHWLEIMIFLMALFVVVSKRRDDILLFQLTGTDMRAVSKAYNLEFVNSCLTIISAVILVAYIIYTVSPEVVAIRPNSQYLYMTTIFVIAGIMRYLQITFVEKRSGSPTEIFLTDKFILITILCWVISFYFLIYY